MLCPTNALALLGLCETREGDASACVAYTSCGTVGLPIAMSMYYLDNPEVTAATGGIGFLAGNALGVVESISFGLSATGAFKQSLTVFTGGSSGDAKSIVSVNGNAMVTMNWNLAQLLPEDVKTLSLLREL